MPMVTSMVRFNYVIITFMLNKKALSLWRYLCWVLKNIRIILPKSRNFKMSYN